MKAALLAALWVGVGGFVGSVARFALASAVYRLAPHWAFPTGTLAVNFAGCLAIGWLAGWNETRHALGPDARLLVFAGLLGGFTTFSAFGYETVALLRGGQGLAAGANVALHLVLVVPAVWLGMRLAGVR